MAKIIKANQVKLYGNKATLVVLHFCKQRNQNYLHWLVEYSNVVTELERHAKQNNETHPDQIERQVLENQQNAIWCVRFFSHLSYFV